MLEAVVETERNGTATERGARRVKDRVKGRGRDRNDWIGSMREGATGGGTGLFDGREKDSERVSVWNPTSWGMEEVFGNKRRCRVGGRECMREGWRRVGGREGEYW